MSLNSRLLVCGVLSCAVLSQCLSVGAVDGSGVIGDPGVIDSSGVIGSSNVTGGVEIDVGCDSPDISDVIHSEDLPEDYRTARVVFSSSSENEPTYDSENNKLFANGIPITIVAPDDADAYTAKVIWDSGSIEVPEGVMVYGGKYDGDVMSTYINFIGGTVSRVIGGCDYGDVAKESVVLISGDAISTSCVMGGSSHGNVTVTRVEQSGGQSYFLAGGGGLNEYDGDEGEAYVVETHVTISGGTCTYAFGGGMTGNTGYTYVDVTGGTISAVYGGSRSDGTYVDVTHVDISGGAATDVYGGGDNGYTRESTNLNITGADEGHSYGCILGDCYYSTHAGGVANVKVSDVSILYVFVGGGCIMGSVQKVSAQLDNVTFPGNSWCIGGSCGQSSGEDNNIFRVYYTEMTLNDCTFESGSIVAGGYDVTAKTGTANLTLNNCTCAYVRGGRSGAIGNVLITLNDCTVSGSVSGGGIYGQVGSAKVVLNNTSSNWVYGGSAATGLTPNAEVVVNGDCTINSLAGGASKGQTDTTKVVVNGGTIKYIYGGGFNDGSVVNNAYIEIYGGTIKYCRGGSSYGDVGHTSIWVDGEDCEIYSLFGGGYSANTHTIRSGDLKILNGYVNSAGGGDCTTVAEYTQKCSITVTIGGDGFEDPYIKYLYWGNNVENATDWTTVTGYIKSGAIYSINKGYAQSRNITVTHMNNEYIGLDTSVDNYVDEDGNEVHISCISKVVDGTKYSDLTNGLDVTTPVKVKITLGDDEWYTWLLEDKYVNLRLKYRAIGVGELRIDLIGVCSFHNTKEHTSSDMVYPEVEPFDDATYDVSYSSLDSGKVSISATLNGSPIASGNTASMGAQVRFTANMLDDAVFGGWRVNGVECDGDEGAGGLTLTQQITGDIYVEAYARGDASFTFGPVVGDSLTDGVRVSVYKGDECVGVFNPGDTSMASVYGAIAGEMYKFKYEIEDGKDIMFYQWLVDGEDVDFGADGSLNLEMTDDVSCVQAVCADTTELKKVVDLWTPIIEAGILTGDVANYKLTESKRDNLFSTYPRALAILSVPGTVSSGNNIENTLALNVQSLTSYYNSLQYRVNNQTLQIKVDGGENITGKTVDDVTGSGYYTAGETVTLKVPLVTGYAFKDFMCVDGLTRDAVNLKSVSTSSTTENTYTFTMPYSWVEMTELNYDAIIYTAILKVFSSQADMGTVTATVGDAGDGGDVTAYEVSREEGSSGDLTVSIPVRIVDTLYVDMRANVGYCVKSIRHSTGVDYDSKVYEVGDDSYQRMLIMDSRHAIFSDSAFTSDMKYYFVFDIDYKLLMLPEDTDSGVTISLGEEATDDIVSTEVGGVRTIKVRPNAKVFCNLSAPRGVETDGSKLRYKYLEDLGNGEYGEDYVVCSLNRNESDTDGGYYFVMPDADTTVYWMFTVGIADDAKDWIDVEGAEDAGSVESVEGAKGQEIVVTPKKLQDDVEILISINGGVDSDGNVLSGRIDDMIAELQQYLGDGVTSISLRSLRYKFMIPNDDVELSVVTKMRD